MTRKHGPGTQAIKRRGVAVDGSEIIAAIREGRLTRGQFDAWHELRRREGTGIVITMRETPPPPFRRPARRHKAR
jgi:hypothetical protein